MPMIHVMVSERMHDRGMTRWTCMQCDRCWEVFDDDRRNLIAKGEQWVQHVPRNGLFNVYTEIDAEAADTYRFY